MLTIHILNEASCGESQPTMESSSLDCGQPTYRAGFAGDDTVYSRIPYGRRSRAPGSKRGTRRANSFEFRATECHLVPCFEDVLFIGVHTRQEFWI